MSDDSRHLALELAASQKHLSTHEQIAAAHAYYTFLTTLETNR